MGRMCIYICLYVECASRPQTHTYTHTHTQRHTHYAHSCSVILNNKCPVVDVAAAVDLRLRVAASSTLDVFHENKIIFTIPLAVSLFWSPSLPLSLLWSVRSGPCGQFRVFSKSAVNSYSIKQSQNVAVNKLKPIHGELKRRLVIMHIRDFHSIYARQPQLYRHHIR